MKLWTSLPKWPFVWISSPTLPSQVHCFFVAISCASCRLLAELAKFCLRGPRIKFVCHTWLAHGTSKGCWMYRNIESIWIYHVTFHSFSIIFLWVSRFHLIQYDIHIFRCNDVFWLTRRCGHVRHLPSVSPRPIVRGHSSCLERAMRIVRFELLELTHFCCW